MHAVLIVTIVFGGIVLGLAVVASTILIAIKILKGGASPGGQKLETEEARMVQEIHEGLSRMEQRVEAIETIILDRKRKERQS